MFVFAKDPTEFRQLRHGRSIDVDNSEHVSTALDSDESSVISARSPRAPRGFLLITLWPQALSAMLRKFGDYLLNSSQRFSFYKFWKNSHLTWWGAVNFIGVIVTSPVAVVGHALYAATNALHRTTQLITHTLNVFYSLFAKFVGLFGLELEHAPLRRSLKGMFVNLVPLLTAALFIACFFAPPLAPAVALMFMLSSSVYAVAFLPMLIIAYQIVTGLMSLIATTVADKIEACCPPQYDADGFKAKYNNDSDDHIPMHHSLNNTNNNNTNKNATKHTSDPTSYDFENDKTNHNDDDDSDELRTSRFSCLPCLPL